MEITGQKMAKTSGEAITLLASFGEVVCEHGMYFSASKKSVHIIKMVEEQNVKRPEGRPPYRQIITPFRSNNTPFRPNNSSNRPIVS